MAPVEFDDIGYVQPGSERVLEQEGIPAVVLSTTLGFTVRVEGKGIKYYSESDAPVQFDNGITAKAASIVKQTAPFETTTVGN